MTAAQRQDLAAVWGPLVLLGLAAAVGRMVEREPPTPITEVTMMILVYGALPYAAWAVYASHAVCTRPAESLSRLRWLAPLHFSAAYLALACVIGAFLGRLATFLALGVLGAAVALVIGYPWLLLTRGLGRMRRGAEGRSPVMRRE